MYTSVKVRAEIPFSPHFSFLGLGSCFVQNVAPALAEWGMPYQYNPLGTSFNPISIAQQLRWLLDPEFDLPEPILHHTTYHQLHAAARFHSPDPQTLHAEVEHQRALFREFLASAPEVNLLISFGTAHAWHYDGAVVNNCHKLPGSFFRRSLLSIAEMKAAWEEVLPYVPAHWNIIYTVSPVRYTRIGLQENFLGKSALRLLIAELIPTRNQSFYFPSFEIVTDELRDYSFFKGGTHPTDEAVEVVMSRFKEFISL